MAAYRDKEDLIAIGAYQAGSDPVVDEAVAKRPAIEAFLQQTVHDVSDAEMADAQLLGLAGVEAGPVIDMDGPVVEPPPPGAPGESAIPPLHLSV
jgi:flagellum-specific ATP synthase